jgi:hypothetical protein
MVQNQTVGNAKQVCPRRTALAVASSGLPGSAVHFLQEIVRHVVPSNHRQQETAHGLAVLADPLGQPIVMFILVLRRGHLALQTWTVKVYCRRTARKKRCCTKSAIWT